MSCMKAVVVNPAKMNRTGSAPSRKSSNTSGKGTTSTAAREAEGIAMDCSICQDLERAFDSRRSKYIEARSAAYYRVSTELAAKKNVDDMERAKSDLEEHQLVCVSAAKVRPSGSRAARAAKRQQVNEKNERSI